MIGSSSASDWLIKQSKFQTNHKVMWNKTSESNPGIFQLLISENLLTIQSLGKVLKITEELTHEINKERGGKRSHLLK